MEQFGSGLVADISVPNTPIIADALDYAQRLTEPYLFNHAVRSWLFAISIARAKNIDYDSEVVAIGTILHDIGLTDSVTGPKGLAQIASYQAVPQINARRLIPVLTDYIARRRGHYICYLERRHLPGRIKVFVDFVCSRIRARDLLLRP